MVVTVFLLDKDFIIQAVLDKKISWSYNKAINKATSINVSIPREDLSSTSKSNLISIAQYIQIYCDGVYTVGGRITKRDISDSVVDITAFTEEIRMESVICPADYSRKYDNWDIADIVRDLNRGWQTKRIKSTSQWGTAVDSSNVDFNTLSNRIMLTKNGAGVYNQDGYVTYRFFASDTEGFTSWDRIRWVSDNFSQTSDGTIELVRTTVQYRYGATTGTLGSWSTPVVGASPDKLGLDISLLDAPVLEVRVNLHTDDLTSEDASGNPIGSSPVVFALEVISRKAPYISTSNVPVSTGVYAPGLIANEDSAFKILSSVCEIADWEFEVYSNNIYLADRLGNDLTDSFVFKKNENIKITQLSDSDDDLVNILHANGNGDGIDRLSITVEDEESVSLYGAYPHTMSFDTDDFDELTTLAEDYLEKHSSALVDWKVETFDSIDSTITNNATPEETLAFHRIYSTTTFSAPSSTNLVEQNLMFYKPVFQVGDTIRIVDPILGNINDARILEEKRSGDVNGIKVALYLNKAKDVLAIRIPKPVEGNVLDAPTSVSIKPEIGGLTITVPAPNNRNRWADTEIFMSETSPVPVDTPIKASRDTSFTLRGLDSTKRYYFIARYVDINQRASGVSGELSGVPLAITEEDLNVVTGLGIKHNASADGYITLCGKNIDGALIDGSNGLIYSNADDALITITNQEIDCTHTSFRTSENNGDFWTYLIYSSGVVTPVHYSVADATFYDKLGNVITGGVGIGKVKVTTVESEAFIYESAPFAYTMELASIIREQTEQAFKYLSHASTPAEFEQFANNLGITDFFTTLAVWDLFVEKLKVNQLQVGHGNKTSGFVFYAIDDDITGEQTIQVWADGAQIFEINPNTKNITIGDYDNGNGAIWDNVLKKFYVKGNINADSGVIKGQLDTLTLSTLLGGDTEYPKGNFTTLESLLTLLIGEVGPNTPLRVTGTINGAGFKSVTYGNIVVQQARRYNSEGVLWETWYKSASALVCTVAITFMMDDDSTNTYVLRKIKANTESSTNTITYAAYPASPGSFTELISWSDYYAPDPSPGKVPSAVSESQFNDVLPLRVFPHPVLSLSVWDSSKERLFLKSLPTSAPSESGRVWRNGSTLMIVP